MEPLISIITVTYNCAKDLKLTAESIRNQTFEDYEWIVIDGKSTDGTLDILESNSEAVSYWVSEKDKGIYDAMNKGMKVACGKYVQFMNAGDLYDNSSTLAKVGAAVCASEACDVLAGNFKVTDLDYNLLFNGKCKEFTIENVRQFGTGTVNHQAFFIKRKLAPEYNLNYRLKAELNWYIDILKMPLKLVVRSLDESLIIYKVGGLGNQKYLLNLWEWMKVTQSQFGVVQNFRNLGAYCRFIKYIRRIKRHY